MNNIDPYEKLALIYDKLMSHVNYQQWAKYIISLFKFSDIKINSVIDISCGTGSLLQNFIKYKYLIYGADLSYPMISQAQRKIGKNSFLNNDVKKLAIRSNQFDVVLFMYDSLNYMHDENQINLLFGEVNRILNPGGIFIFDIITDLLCKTHYKNFEEEEDWGQSGYIRHSYYNVFNKVQHNDFRIKINNEIFFESHVQKVFKESEIAKYLNLNKFEIAAKLDDFTFYSSGDDSERIHYVCVKK